MRLLGCEGIVSLRQLEISPNARQIYLELFLFQGEGKESEVLDLDGTGGKIFLR